MSPSEAGEHICRSLLPVVTQMEFHFPRALAPVCAHKCFIRSVSQKQEGSQVRFTKLRDLTGRFGPLIRVFPACEILMSSIPSYPKHTRGRVQKNWGEEGRLCLAALTGKEMWPWHSGSFGITWRVCGAGWREDALRSVVLFFPVTLSVLLRCCVFFCFFCFTVLLVL